MKKYYGIGIGAAVLLVVVFVAAQGGAPAVTSAPAASAAPSARTVATATTASPAAARPSASPEDIVPGLYPDPIKNSATTPGLKITSILVENNTDASGNPVSDHLEVTLQNLTDVPLSNLQAYYTITDAANGKKEGYYRSLTGFALPPKGSGTIHFDGQSGYGHFPVNMHGIYGTAMDKLNFTVEISVPGYAPVHGTATKAPGGAEVVGQ